MPYRLASLCGAIVLIAASGFAAQDRIGGNPRSGRTSIVRNSAHPKAQPQFDRGAVDPAMPIGYATLLFKPAAGLEAFLAAQQNPAATEYHQWLTPEQFGDRFGLSAADLDKIVAWLRSEGFSINDVARGRHWITFSGTAAQASHAFHSEIHKFLADGAMHFAAAGSLSIPAEFEGVVSNVTGLDDFSARALYQVQNTAGAPAYNVGNSHLLAPDDIAAIYNIAPVYQAGIDGTGQKIAVIGRTNIDLADIRAFRKAFNLAANDPQVMLIGSDPGTTADVTEASLDLEWSGAIARNATIIYVNSTSVRTSAQYAVDQNIAPVMTYSYASCEQETLDTVRSIAQQANAQGITWLAASGDWGAAGCDLTSASPEASRGFGVSYPASIPEITAVGGTEFSEGMGTFWAAANGANSGSALSYIPEVAWNDSASRNGLSSTGGGVSVFFPKPWWQVASGVPLDNVRDVPDVSFAASPDHDGYAIVSQGQHLVVGGTSVSSPLFAGVVALLNHSQIVNKKQTAGGLGNINPALYRLASTQSGIFHDVTGGDNKVQCQQGSPNCVGGMLGYSAGNGYDLTTGLGSVDVSRLLSGWNSGTPSTTTLSATPQSLLAGDNSVTLQASVQSESGTPAGTVTFLSNDTNIGSAPLNGGIASVIVSAPLIAAGNGSVSALYSGDATWAPSSASANVALAVSTTASYMVPSVSPNPVHEVNGQWTMTVTLTQRANIATTITAFTVGGADAFSLLPKTSYPGTFSVNVLLSVRLAAPTTGNVHFAGTDAGGAAWVVDLPLQFLGPEGPSINPGIAVTGTPSTVQQNTSADPSCQWQQQINVQETGGFQVTLSKLTAGPTDLTGSMSQIFGTTRLAPFGRLGGSVCLSGVTPPAQTKITLQGSADSGASVAGSYTASLAAPTASSTTMSPSATSVIMSAVPASVDLTFGAGLPAWTATVLNSGYSNFLTVSPTSGTGPATLTLQANGKGLSNGVYNAVLSIQAMNTNPQLIQIPVAFVVSGNTGTSIMGVNSAASAAQAFAPGMWMAVYGSNLAPSTQLASRLPLPLSLAGASATVNGIAAPLWFVSAGQMNVQIPYETGAGPAILGVNNNGSTAAFAFTVSPTAPGIFDTGITGKPGQTIVAYISGEGDVTPTLATGYIPVGVTDYHNFPHPRQPISITVGGEPANIAFAGIVSLVGSTQVNFTIPGDMKPGTQRLVVTVGGVASAPVNITVTAP